jgi:hypothetical protein
LLQGAELCLQDHGTLHLFVVEEILSHQTVYAKESDL